MVSSFHRRLIRAARQTAGSRLMETGSALQRALGAALPGLGARPDLPLRAATETPIGSILNGLGLSPRARGAGEPEAALPLPAGADFRSGTFTGPTGTRPYRLFVPSHPAQPPPLLVMLHGCGQTAEDFAAGTRINGLAQQRGWLVLYPVQTRGANLQRCWNWFNAADQQRGQGETAVIADMTRSVMAEYAVDPGAVFVAGLSAGGAEAALLGALYPDLFAAIGVHSGLACGAATDMGSAFMAMRAGRPGGPAQPMAAIVFHGDQDSTVNPRNADAVLAQVAQGATAEAERGQVPGGLAYERRVFRLANGRASAEQWCIQGAGHAWSGGSAAGSYTEPAGPDASAEMLRFFEAHRR